MAMQVLSYELIKRLDSNHRIKKILEIVKKGDIVMIEGKLTSEEETQLISNALANVSGKFSGIEVAYLDSFKAETVFDMVKDKLLKAIAKDRFGITVVGPSKVIKEIKMDPNKLEILFK